ncbi:hypothetical protein ZWY2020_041542 [Hordeum vulgare]|nr:hypothetical protein ZWY2020_041542 [Hordeum vulgare]
MFILELGVWLLPFTLLLAPARRLVHLVRELQRILLVVACGRRTPAAFAEDTLKSSPKSPEVASKEAQPQDSSNVEVKVLSERLSFVVSDIRAKDDLVKQHSKVAEEVVLGWEKAQNEIASLKNQLNATTVKNSTLDGALKECVRQLRRAKEEQDQKVQGALALQSQQWESDNTDLELRIVELKAQLEAKSERSVTSDGDASSTKQPDCEEAHWCCFYFGHLGGGYRTHCYI